MRLLLLLFYVPMFYAVYGFVRMLTLLGLPRGNRNDSVLFLESMGPPSAGYRYRSNGLAKALRSDENVSADVWFVIDHTRQKELQQTKAGMIRLHLIYLFKRLGQCWRSAGYGTVVVRRELLLYNDYGNLFFEKWMRRIHGNLVLDIDDDISAAKREPRVVSRFGKTMLEHPLKFRASLLHYDKLIVASNYLKEHTAAWWNKSDDNIFVLPACFDVNGMPVKLYNDNVSVATTMEPGATERSKARQASVNAGDARRLQKEVDERSGSAYGTGLNQTAEEPMKLLWVGSRNNLVELYSIYDAIDDIGKRHRAALHVICDAMPKPPANVPLIYRAWSASNPYAGFTECDIGLMPVIDSDEGKGKGGLKLLEYMACGLVAVASGITVNNDIVTHGVNGFLVTGRGSWEQTLREVFQQRQRFVQIGAAARANISERYCYDANLTKVLAFLRF